MKKLVKALAKWAVLLAGLYVAAVALWDLGRTAAFVYRAEVAVGKVVDVKERPFTGMREMMLHGNLPWQGSTAYQPYVLYKLPDRWKRDETLPDLDCRNYAIAQTVEVIYDPLNPDHRHLNSTRFLWGGSLLALLGGALLTLLGYFLLRRRRAARPTRRAPAPARAEHAPAPPPAPAPAPADKPAPKRRRSRPAPKPEAPEDDFCLVADEAPPKRRRRRPADPTKPARTRAAKSTDPAAPKPAPKRRRKKQTAPTD